MRAEPDKFNRPIIRLAVDQDEVRPDVAIPAIAPLASKRVIKVSPWQILIVRQNRDGFEEMSIKLSAVPPRFLAFVIATEAARVSNTPHSSRRAALPARRVPSARHVALP